MAKIVVTKVRSSINSPKIQKRTLEALGLRKINSSREHEKNSVIMGMIRKVNHLVTYTEI